VGVGVVGVWGGGCGFGGFVIFWRGCFWVFVYVIGLGVVCGGVVFLPEGPSTITVGVHFKRSYSA